MKNTKKFGFRGSGTVIIFLVIIAFIFAAMTACEGAVGAAGKPGDAGKDGVAGGDKLTLGPDGYWYINGVPTDIKVEGLAELKLNKTATFKETYLANQGLNMTGFTVDVGYNDTTIENTKVYKFTKQVTDYILVWKKDATTEVMLGRFGKTNVDGVSTPGNWFSKEVTDQEGVQTLLVYGPAAEPASFDIEVIAYDFANAPTLAKTTGGTPGNYGDQLTATFKIVWADQDQDLIDPETMNLANLGTGVSPWDNGATAPTVVKFQFYHGTTLYKQQEVSVIKSAVGPLAATGTTEITITATVRAYAAGGAYSVGVSAIGFREKKNDPAANVPALGFTFTGDTGVGYLEKFMAQSDIGTTYDITLVDAAKEATIAFPPTLKAAILKGNDSGVRVNLDLAEYKGKADSAPNTFSTISDNFFEGCEALVSVNLPSTIAGGAASIGAKVFNQCPNLVGITVVPQLDVSDLPKDEGDQFYVSDNGVLYRVATPGTYAIGDNPDFNGTTLESGDSRIGHKFIAEKELVCWPAKRPIQNNLITIDHITTIVRGHAITHNNSLKTLEIKGKDAKIAFADEGVVFCANLDKVILRQALSTNVTVGTLNWYGDLRAVITAAASRPSPNNTTMGTYNGRALDTSSTTCTIWRVQ